MKKRVADIIMTLLVENEITTCFSVVGGGSMHLDNALMLNDKIEKIFNHHEQACAMAADAYARFSGKMAAVCVTSGPGATNTLTGVMGAWQDSLPMIVISGNVRYDISVEKTGLPLRYRGVQEFDITNSIKNMTKYSVIIKDPLSIKQEINKAIKISMSGRRGPVWIDVPLDMQNAVVETDDLYPDYYVEELPKKEKLNLSEISSLLSSAKRPCIVIGSGLVSSHSQEKFLKFIEKINIPVIGGAWIADVFYNEHPLFYGLSGNVGPRTGNFILQNADVILTLGCSLSFNITGYNVAEFAPHAKIIMVDVDKNEHLKMKDKISIFVHADIKDFMDECLLKGLNISASKQWFEYCDMLRNKFNPFEGAENIKMDERVNKYHFWKVFDEIMPDGTNLALANSSCNGAKLQVGKKFMNQRVITNYMCGSMGYDLPAAIGTALASKKEVLCVAGDGSIMMNLQELATIIYYKLPIKIILFENNGYNAIKQTCKNFFNGVEMGCSPASGVGFPKFKEVAKAFGFEYKLCSTNSEVRDSLDWIKKTDGNVFLEIKQQNDDPLIPKVMSRINEEGKMVSPALQDLFPFIDETELKSLMLWDKDEWK